MFVLAVFVGFYVISNVHHALHTPLMASPTRSPGSSWSARCCRSAVDNLAVRCIAVVAILLATINIFGGFLVTRRMLRMFRKG